MTKTEDKKTTVELIQEGKTPQLLKYVPKGESPKVFIDLVKNQVMGVDSQGKPRPDEDLMLFLYTCKRTGLDPLAKQIYAVYRWDSRLGREKMTIQVGIDGMRLVAQRTGQYAGQDDAEFLPADESAPLPQKATVTVKKRMKDGTIITTSATARWNEYCQKGKDGNPMGMWARMPYNQLAKCAEALALRKAFPNELAGIVSEDEMGQASNILAGIPAPVKKPNIQVEQGAPVEARTILVDETPKDAPVEVGIVDTPPAPKPPTIEETVAKQAAAMPTKQAGAPIAKNSIVEVRAKIKSMQERAKNENK